MKFKIKHEITEVSRILNEHSLYIFNIKLHAKIKIDDKKVEYIVCKKIILNVDGVLFDISNEFEEIIENHENYYDIEDVLEEIEDEYMDKVIEELAAKIPQLENCFQKI